MLLADYFPLLIQVQPAVFTQEAVQQMAEEFEVYFARGERYVVVTVQPKNSSRPGAKERKLVANWVNSPRVMKYASKLCVGSANVITNSFDRGLLTALLWLWRPPFPLKVFSDADSALDFAFEKLEEASLVLPHPPSELRLRVARHLREVV